MILESMDQNVHVFFSLLARLHIHVACKYVLVCVFICSALCLFYIHNLRASCMAECPMLDRILLHLHHFPSLYYVHAIVCANVLFDYRLQLRVHVHLNCQLQQKPKLDHSLASSFVHFNIFVPAISPCICHCNRSV